MSYTSHPPVPLCYSPLHLPWTTVITVGVGNRKMPIWRQFALSFERQHCRYAWAASFLLPVSSLTSTSLNLSLGTFAFTARICLCLFTFKFCVILYAFFWVIPRRLNFICRRFGSKIAWAYWLRLFLSETFSRINSPTFSNLVILHKYPPMKMEETECSETSAYKIQTPWNNPEESIHNSENGESLKSRILY